MLRHFITTIDYKKLIEMQASEVQTRVSPVKSKSLNAYKKENKVKKYNFKNSVKRHH